MSKKAFTLIELLIVVLIIGILSAIAIPMYQGAVDKSHWSTMLPGAKAIKDAEEAVRMTNGLYTANMENLDVSMPSSDVTYTLRTINNGDTANLVIATNHKIPNVRLSSYLDENVSYAGRLFCEANDAEDGRGARLCEKLLQGQKTFTTPDSYTAYLIDSPCRSGSHYLESDKCGFENIDKQHIANGEICVGTGTRGCQYSVVEEGGECLGRAYGGCSRSTIQDGGTCKGEADSSCQILTIEDGGTCSGLAGAACDNSTIKSGGICEGSAYTACGQPTIEEGGVCMGEAAHACHHPTVNGGLVICAAGECGRHGTYNGGVCVGNGGGCNATSFVNGAVCYANAPGESGV